jgi:hypothetical protein
MLRRRQVKHTVSLEERIAERIDEIRAKAEALPLGSSERARMEEDSANQIYRLDQSPSAEAERLRKEARGTPPGVRRDQLLRRARQIETASRVRKWPASPGPRPPE